MGRVRDSLPSVFTGLLRMPLCLQECCKDYLALVPDVARFIHFRGASFVLTKGAGERALTGSPLSV